MSDTDHRPPNNGRPLPPSAHAILGRLQRVAPHLASTLQADAPLVRSGDSIDLVELLCAIDADYGVRLTTDDLAQLRTTGDLLTLIDRRATRRPSPSLP